MASASRSRSPLGSRVGDFPTKAPHFDDGVVVGGEPEELTAGIQMAALTR
ncbi:MULTISPECIES: hypothetical protein [unclassified Mesorhizobium]